MAQRVAVVRLLLRHDFAMARSAITVCFSDDLPSTLTNQSASLYDEIRDVDDPAPALKVAQADVGGLAEGIAFSPDGRYLYVGNFENGSRNDHRHRLCRR